MELFFQVLDSEYLPSRREDKHNFYKLFLAEQERDTCVDLRLLLSTFHPFSSRNTWSRQLPLHSNYAARNFFYIFINYILGNSEMDIKMNREISWKVFEWN